MIVNIDIDPRTLAGEVKKQVDLLGEARQLKEERDYWEREFHKLQVKVSQLIGLLEDIQKSMQL